MDRLVGYGAELNVQDELGQTPLHLILSEMTTIVLRHTADMPEMMKVLYLSIYVLSQLSDHLSTLKKNLKYLNTPALTAYAKKTMSKILLTKHMPLVWIDDVLIIEPIVSHCYPIPGIT